MAQVSVALWIGIGVISAAASSAVNAYLRRISTRPSLTEEPAIAFLVGFFPSLVAVLAVVAISDRAPNRSAQITFVITFIAVAYGLKIIDDARKRYGTS